MTSTTDSTTRLTRIHVGDVRVAHGREWTVMRRERGRAGEARTMYVVGSPDADGVVRAQETRTRVTVAGWPLVRRAGSAHAPR